MSEKVNRVVARILLPMLVVLSLIAPFVLKINGYDCTSHLIWLASFPTLIREGILIPRWLPDSFGGLGAASFYFYPPLAYYFGAVVSLFHSSFSASTLYHVVGWFGTWASFLTCIYFLKTLGVSRARSMVSSLLYALAPYRFYDLYIRDGYAEHIGFIFIPLFFAGLIGILRPKWKTREFVLVVFSWAAIILSNIPLMILTAVAAIPVIFILPERTERIRAWMRAVGSLLLGSGVTAYFLLPILHFKPYAQIGHLLNGLNGPPNPFYLIWFLLKPSTLTYALVGFCDGFAAVVIFWQAIRLVRQEKGENGLTDRLTRAAIWILAGIFFLEIPPISLWLWQHFVVLTLIQFTWRFEIIVMLLVVMFATIWNPKYAQNISYVAALWCIGGIVLVGMNDFGLKVHHDATSYTKYDPAEYATAFTSNDIYGIIQFTDLHKNDPYITPIQPYHAGESISAVRTDEGGAEFDCKLDSAHAVILHTFYWPDWGCEAAGNAIRVAPYEDSSNTDGRITITFPAGQYTAELKLIRSKAEIIGDDISIASLIATLGIALVLWRRKKGAITS